MSELQRKGVIMAFARAPVPGQTKTRLIPALGAEGAARLHRSLIDRTLSKMVVVSGADIALWCAPSIDNAFLKSCARKYDIPLYLQHGDDLGLRMHHAFENALQDAPWAILIGTDIPELKTADVQQAVDELRYGADAVIGPARDGGYYLLGLRQVSPMLFKGMPWGTGQVWSLTQERLISLGWSCSTVAVHRDLDRPQDLDYFPDIFRLS